MTDLPTPPDGAEGPNLSSDNNTIVYKTPGQGLMLGARDGSFDPHVINTDMTINTASFSPDGKQMVYMVRQPPTWQIVVASADGGNPRLLTSLNPLDFQHPDNVAPSWSPDGKQILFLSNRNGKWEFFTINVGGSGAQQVLKNVTDQVSIVYDYNGARVATWR